MAQGGEYWTLDERVASLRLKNANAHVDVASPHLGLQALNLDSRTVEGQLLSLSPSEAAATWPARVADAYVRGPDLVATYTGEKNWPYAPQVYWSADSDTADGGCAAALTLVVSIQTSLLDTYPRIDVRSSLPADEVLLATVVGGEMLVDSHALGPQRVDPRSTACGIFWRLKDSALSYAEIMPTSDFRSLVIDRNPDGQTQSRWELFAEFLEKGVIRRARLQSVFVPRENDVQLVAERCRTIEHRPLPLTT